MYGDDLPSSKSFPSELHLWQQKWSSHAEVASALNTPEKALKHADGDFSPKYSSAAKYYENYSSHMFVTVSGQEACSG